MSVSGHFYSYVHQSVSHLLAYNWSLSTSKALSQFKKTNKIDKIYWKQLVALRTSSFKLQSFGRVVRHSMQPEFSEAGLHIRALSKNIEDALGRLLYGFEMHAEVVLAKDKKSISTSSASYVKKSFVAFEKDLLTFESQLLEIHDLIQFIEELSPCLRSLYLVGLTDELKKVSRKIKEDINSHLLEDGTHKLRRLLRWVIMHIIYPQGLFCYQEAGRGLGSSFLSLKPHRQNRPVELPFEFLEKVSTYVAQLGSVKDKGLYHHYVQALNGQNVDINTSDSMTIYMSGDIQQDIIETKVLKKLRKLIDKQI